MLPFLHSSCDLCLSCFADVLFFFSSIFVEAARLLRLDGLRLVANGFSEVNMDKLLLPTIRGQPSFSLDMGLWIPRSTDSTDASLWEDVGGPQASSLTLPLEVLFLPFVRIASEGEADCEACKAVK